MSIRDKAIEAAARAMCEDRHRYRLRSAEDVASYVEHYWRDYADAAGMALDAILTVLAEPDDAMVEAAGGDYVSLERCDDQSYRPAEVWREMIAKVSE